MQLTNPKTGEVLESELSDYQAVKVCSTIPGDFPRSLVERYPQISECQRFWLHKLAKDNVGEQFPAGSYDKVVHMFDVARKRLKYPSIRFKTDEGTVRFDLTPSHVRIRCGARFVGRLFPDDRLVKSNMAERTYLLVKMMCVDPLKAAVLWGIRTNRCCFCFQELTDERSVAAGYGPICASNWELPWGDRAGARVTCPKCVEFFAVYRCNSPDECDCPKCQGLCECS